MAAGDGMFIGEDEKSPLDNNKTNRSDKKTDNNKLLNASSLVWSRAGFPTGHDAKPKASGKATQARGSEKKQTPPKNKSSKSVMLMVDGGGTDNKNNQGEEKKKKRKKKKKSKGKASVKDGTGGMREGPGQGLRGAGAGGPFKVTLTPHLLPTYYRHPRHPSPHLSHLLRIQEEYFYQGTPDFSTNTPSHCKYLPSLPLLHYHPPIRYSRLGLHLFVMRCWCVSAMD